MNQPYGMRRVRSILLGALLVAVPAGAGLYIGHGHAATFVVASESELGAPVGNLAKTTGAGSSGGQAVKFGSFSVPDRPVKLMPFGSSTIVGGGDPAGGGFRPQLYDNLTRKDKLTVDFVGSIASGPTNFDRDHEGHGGWTIGTGTAGSGIELSAIVIDKLNTYKPDIMLFYAGTNDVLGDGNDGPAATARFDAIAAKIFANSPNLRMVVGTLVIPRQSAVGISNIQRDNARQFNASLEGVAATYRKKGFYMQVVDTGKVVNDPADYADDLHSNPAGYAKMAEVWYKGVRATYPTF